MYLSYFGASLTGRSVGASKVAWGCSEMVQYDSVRTYGLHVGINGYVSAQISFVRLRIICAVCQVIIQRKDALTSRRLTTFSLRRPCDKH